MGVVTLTLPSGYEADTTDLVEMNKQVGAKRVDRNDNEINIYVDKVWKVGNCSFMREIAQDFKTDLRFQPSAVMALQEASEAEV